MIEEEEGNIQIAAVTLRGPFLSSFVHQNFQWGNGRVGRSSSAPFFCREQLPGCVNLSPRMDCMNILNIEDSRVTPIKIQPAPLELPDQPTLMIGRLSALLTKD